MRTKHRPCIIDKGMCRGGSWPQAFTIITQERMWT